VALPASRSGASPAFRFGVEALFSDNVVWAISKRGSPTALRRQDAAGPRHIFYTLCTPVFAIKKSRTADVR
jgi:hypothetical protein